MSGHSRWAQIHRQKGVLDTKKGALFTKLGNAITVATKEGGGNPESNFKLRLTIDQAKSANMPKDNIERAIKRGTGELKDGIIEKITYEGFGPQGIAIILEILTDNRNRASAAIKHILSKHGGNLGTPNSVKWMFEQKGVIRVSQLKEEVQLKLIDAGAQDIQQEKNEMVIYSKPANLKKIKEILEKKGIKIEYAELDLIPKEKLKITAKEVKEKLEKFFNDLDENEDINNYYTNVEDF